MDLTDKQIGSLRSCYRSAISHLLPSAGYLRDTLLAVNRWHSSPVGLTSTCWVLDRAAPFARLSVLQRSLCRPESSRSARGDEFRDIRGGFSSGKIRVRNPKDETRAALGATGRKRRREERKKGRNSQSQGRASPRPGGERVDHTTRQPHEGKEGRQAGKLTGRPLSADSSTIVGLRPGIVCKYLAERSSRGSLPARKAPSLRGGDVVSSASRGISRSQPGTQRTATVGVLRIITLAHFRDRRNQYESAARIRRGLLREKRSVRRREFAFFMRNKTNQHVANTRSCFV